MRFPVSSETIEKGSCFVEGNSSLLLSGVKFSFDLRGGDFRGAGEIDHFALILQEVELAFPVVAHDKDIDVVFFHIGFLLVPVVFGNNQIYIADGLQHGLTLFIGKIAFLLLLVPVEFVGG